MDTEGDAHAAEQAPRRTAQVDNAIRAIQEKKPLPEIDFTIHMMEDGNQVSTLERVCKGTFDCTPCLFCRAQLLSTTPPLLLSIGACCFPPSMSQLRRR
jgi:hypothetical protein